MSFLYFFYIFQTVPLKIPPSVFLWHSRLWYWLLTLPKMQGWAPDVALYQKVEVTFRFPTCWFQNFFHATVGPTWKSYDSYRSPGLTVYFSISLNHHRMSPRHYKTKFLCGTRMLQTCKSPNILVLRHAHFFLGIQQSVLALIFYPVAWTGYTKSPGQWLYKKRLIWFVLSQIFLNFNPPQQLLMKYTPPSHAVFSRIQFFFVSVYPNLPKYTAARVSDLQTIISPYQQILFFIFAHKLSIATSDQENGFKLNTRWYKCPDLFNHIYPIISDVCCHNMTYSLWWKYPLINAFSEHIIDIYYRITTSQIPTPQRWHYYL